MPFVDLTYFVWSQRLVGTIGNAAFSMRAVSGGGRGGHAPQSSMASFSPYRAKDGARGVRGGTLPPGYYKVESHTRYRGAIKGPPISKLTPIHLDPAFGGDRQHASYGRDFQREPFLIHGPGVKGSDGCIVIDLVHRKPLLLAAHDAGLVVLRVTLDDPDGMLPSPNLTARA